MNEIQRETLSAMLDDETDTLELRRLLRNSGDDPELLGVWERYHLARAVLHKNRIARLGDDFHVQVASRLRDEPAPGRIRAFASGRQFAGKFAIAAAVAAAVFIGLQAGLDPAPAAPRVASETAIETRSSGSATPAAPVTQVVEVAAGQAAPVDPEARQRLLEYIESMRFDPTEPPRMEHIEDSPLFHLVNDLQN